MNSSASANPDGAAAAAAFQAAQEALVETFMDSFGALLICTCLGCMLFGLTTHQTYRYFRLYPTDSRGMKGLVLLLLALDTFNTITSIHVCYYYLVAEYFDPSALLSGVWSLRLEIAETGAVILVSHSFYARRLYLLGNRSFFPVGLITILLAIETGFAISATYESFFQVTFEKFEQFTWMIWGVLGSGLVVDLVASSILTYYLRKSRSGWKRSDSIIDIMMVYAINTGLSTGIITAASLVTAVVWPGTLIYAAITVVGNKMYANSLLAVLNSRRSLVDKGLEGFETGSFGLQVFNPRVTTVAQLPHVSPLDPHIPVRRKENEPVDTVIDIKVTTETFMDGPAFPLPHRLRDKDRDGDKDNGKDGDGYGERDDAASGSV